VDEGGNIHSREFLSEELILDDAEDLANVLKRESSHVKVERLKPGTTDVGTSFHDLIKRSGR
jgi:hypothetical protein